MPRVAEWSWSRIRGRQCTSGVLSSGLKDLPRRRAVYEEAVDPSRLKGLGWGSSETPYSCKGPEPYFQQGDPRTINLSSIGCEDTFNDWLFGKTHVISRRTRLQNTVVF
ncbi:hypothetical protein TNCV_2516421 [Trichonephila clavipes]|nr:hypothetical protein TNCV_2516421 [Trichonephila clavipes]